MDRLKVMYEYMHDRYMSLVHFRSDILNLFFK